MEPLLFLLAAIAIAGGLYWSWSRKKKRRQDLSEFALRHRLSYSPDDVHGLLIHPFELFKLGDGRGIEDTIWGRWKDLDVVAADYWYYTETTDSKGHTSRSYHHHSVAVVEVAADLPHLVLKREGVLSRIADHLGFRDIEFESDEFNRRFQVRCDDRAFAFKLIDVRMMQWLTSLEAPLCFEVRGDRLLAYSHRLRPHELVVLLGGAKFFIDRIPRLVWNEYGRHELTSEPL